jgi:hypothetical protein
MVSDKSNNETKRTDAFEIGDKVEHTNSHRIGAVQEVRPWRDGTFELRVHVHALDAWWNSRHVRNLTAEEEEER